MPGAEETGVNDIAGPLRFGEGVDRQVAHCFLPVMQVIAPGKT
jgi:hypothetical protein